jgi:hypothetical protein
MGADALPAWAASIVPVDMDGAAAVLGIGRRTLVDVIRDHPHYERRGTKKVFYPEHVALLREALCQSGEKVSGSTPNSKTPASGMPSVPLPESAFDKALALATKAKPKSKSPSSKLGSGNVITMATRQSARSRKRP